MLQDSFNWILSTLHSIRRVTIHMKFINLIHLYLSTVDELDLLSREKTFRDSHNSPLIDLRLCTVT